MRNTPQFLLLAFLSLFVGNCGKEKLQLILNDDFERAAGNWKPVGPSKWNLTDNPRGGRMS